MTTTSRLARTAVPGASATGTTPASAPAAPVAPAPLPTLRRLVGEVDGESESAEAEAEDATAAEADLADWLGNLTAASGEPTAPSAPKGVHPAVQDLGSRQQKYGATLFSTTVPTTGPFVTKKDDKPQANWASEAFDATKAARDLEALAERIEKFPALKGSAFLAEMKLYVAAAAQGDDARAEQHMRAGLQCLSDRRAFTIGNKVYARQGSGVEGTVLEDLAEQAMSNVVLWSKLNKYQAIDTVAGGEKGNSLEASAAGSLFDDLTFGMHYGSHAVLRKQWSLVSESFVNHAHGVVHAQVLEGIDPNSVLTTTEWPVISRLMRQGVVHGFVVHFFEYENGKLVEFGQRAITHPNQWMTLPSVTEWNDGLNDYSATLQVEKDADGNVVTGTDGKAKQVRSGYASRQNTAHQGENARHEREEQRQRFLDARARFVALESGAT